MLNVGHLTSTVIDPALSGLEFLLAIFPGLSPWVDIWHYRWGESVIPLKDISCRV